MELGQGGGGVVEGGELLGYGGGHFPDAAGQVQTYRNAGFAQDYLFVAGEELETVRVGAEGEGVEFVFAVEIYVGDGVAMLDALFGEGETKLLTRGALDLLNRRPEPDQGVIEIEEDCFNHLES